MVDQRILPIIALIGTMLQGTASANDEMPACSPVYQLRIYEIPPENRQVFHERFRTHAVRIMSRYDFDILSMWESRSGEKIEFVYLLQWPDAATLEERWERFMADEEWAAIKVETAARHGEFVRGIEDRTLCATEYSAESSAR